MAIEHHDFELERSFMVDGVRGCCSCGWEGSVHDDQDGAAEEWENHCDVVFMDATMAGAQSSSSNNDAKASESDG